VTPVSDAQRAGLKQVYAETAGSGQAIYPAQPVGGEGESAGWATWITGGGMTTPQGPSLRFAFGTQFFKYFVFSDPAWDYRKYDVANTRRDARAAAAALNATNADLSAFKAKGRKLILWHGWSDPALTALASVKYYDQVQSKDPGVRDYFRMFMMPGVLHCAGGPGPDNADWAAAISDWVEHAKAPDRIVASKLGPGGAVVRTRPLCPYPQHAEYKGSGSSDEAGSFACRD